MINRYRAAVAVLFVSLAAVEIVYYQQTQELAQSRFDTYQAQAEAKRNAALLRISETNAHAAQAQADKNADAAMVLQTISSQACPTVQACSDPTIQAGHK